MESALLDAAAEILESEGPDALSVRRIAAVAGVAPMGVYNHFDNKYGIVDALFISGFERLRDSMAEAHRMEDPLAALRESGQRYRALALANPMMYQVMFLRAVAGFEPSVRALTVATGAFDALATTVQRGIDAGVLAGPDAIMTAQVIWASIHGWMSLELLGIGPVEAGAEGFDLVCATALQGLHPNLVPGKRA
jgi:AcrR family transcriptional regulator